jgi:D-alanyl-D-alanine carboxypeptidase
MTTVVILEYLEKYKLDSRKIKVNIMGCCITANLGGTSAELLENDSLSVHELLHGMMLPSGNDAA